jgi:hypothetical protein
MHTFNYLNCFRWIVALLISRSKTGISTVDIVLVSLASLYSGHLNTSSLGTKRFRHYITHITGENATHLLQLKPFTEYQIFIPPGTQCCFVARGNVESNLAQGCYTWPVPGHWTPDVLLWSPYVNHSATHTMHSWARDLLLLSDQG